MLRIKFLHRDSMESSQWKYNQKFLRRVSQKIQPHRLSLKYCTPSIADRRDCSCQDSER